MNITVTDQEHCKKQLRLEIPGDKVKAETNEIAAKLARTVSLPGFRPGHVPTSVVKTRFRKELRDEVLSHILPEALKTAIEEKNLKVLGEPSIDELDYGDDDAINVTITVEVQPEFELSNYKGISLAKRVYKIGDEQVDETVERLRLAHAELVPVEDRPAQAGDIVTVNITGKFAPATDEAEQTEEQEGSKAAPAAADKREVTEQDVEIELGGEGVLKEFTEALTGAHAGDTRTFNLTYAPDYAHEQYRGRTVNYAADVTAVRVKELPEVDDQFAGVVNEEYKTVDDLRSSIRSRLEHEAEHRTDDEFRTAIMEALVDRNRFDVPEVVVERQLDSRLRMLISQLANQGMDPRRLQLDWEGLRESQRERAEREVRGFFVLDRIASEENIEVSDEEVDSEIERRSEGMRESAAVLKARLTKEDGLDSIKEQVRNRKALDLVISSADIRIEEVAGLSEQKATTGETGEQTEE
ncbi:MAG TPA: trigger factor [Blastocatellia bacterium]|nr:trigger factor [Blastocatellia bacterium]